MEAGANEKSGEENAVVGRSEVAEENGVDDFVVVEVH